MAHAGEGANCHVGQGVRRSTGAPARSPAPMTAHVHVNLAVCTQGGGGSWPLCPMACFCVLQVVTSRQRLGVRARGTQSRPK